MYYSATTNGFYTQRVNDNNIPEDAVELTAEEYYQLFEGQMLGKIINPDDDGNPVLVNRPEPTLEDLARAAREKRNALLADTDYIMMPDYPLSDKTDVEEYRQALRDITNQPNFPETITWPVVPEIINQEEL